LAQAELVFEYRSSEAAGPAADREEFREGFFAWQDALWKKINLRNDRQSYQGRLFPHGPADIAEFRSGSAPECGCPPGLSRLGGSIFVRQFSKRLEVISPEGCRQNHAREHH
jgi:ATP-dependent DNA helicase RecG